MKKETKEDYTEYSPKKVPNKKYKGTLLIKKEDGTYEYV